MSGHIGHGSEKHADLKKCHVFQQFSLHLLICRVVVQYTCVSKFAGNRKFNFILGKVLPKNTQKSGFGHVSMLAFETDLTTTRNLNAGSPSLGA